MTKSFLFGLAAACNFILAALTYNDGRALITAMEVVAGLLFTVAAVGSAGRATRGRG